MHSNKNAVYMSPITWFQGPSRSWTNASMASHAHSSAIVHMPMPMLCYAACMLCWGMHIPVEIVAASPATLNTDKGLLKSSIY
jgi:hypothetical protein